MSEIYYDKEFVFEEVETIPVNEKKLIAYVKAATSGLSEEDIAENVRVLQAEYDGTRTFISPMFQVLRRELWDTQHGFGKNTPTYLSIKRRDREPLCDWRAKQRIKNAILGDEWEAIEMYPAESRLVDTANQYHLFSWKAVFPIYLFNNREVLTKQSAEDLNRETGFKTKQS